MTDRHVISHWVFIPKYAKNPRQILRGKKGRRKGGGVAPSPQTARFLHVQLTHQTRGMFAARVIKNHI